MDLWWLVNGMACWHTTPTHTNALVVLWCGSHLAQVLHGVCGVLCVVLQQHCTHCRGACVHVCVHLNQPLVVWQLQHWLCGGGVEVVKHWVLLWWPHLVDMVVKLVVDNATNVVDEATVKPPSCVAHLGVGVVVWPCVVVVVGGGGHTTMQHFVVLWCNT